MPGGASAGLAVFVWLGRGRGGDIAALYGAFELELLLALLGGEWFAMVHGRRGLWLVARRDGWLDRMTPIRRDVMERDPLRVHPSVLPRAPIICAVTAVDNPPRLLLIVWWSLAILVAASNTWRGLSTKHTYSMAPLRSLQHLPRRRPPLPPNSLPCYPERRVRARCAGVLRRYDWCAEDE